MFKSKTVKIFDTEKLEEGSFINYCHTKTGDGGEKVEGRVYNALIHYVTEGYITVTNHIGDKRRIDIEDIEKDNIRILGVSKLVF